MPRGALYAWTVFRPAPAALASLAECAPLLSLPLALVSYPLAAGAAVFVGIVEALASFWASSFKEIIVFTIIIPVLLVRSLTATHTEDEE